MDSKHNCIDCARAEIKKMEGDPCYSVGCNIALPIWIERPLLFSPDKEKVMVFGKGVVIENCPAWYPNTPPQWTLPEWKKEGEYAVLSGVTHNGKRWECFKENGGKFGDAVEPGTDPNVWREAK